MQLRLEYALVFGLLAVSFAHIYYESPITSDAYEAARTAELLKTNPFPVENANIAASNTRYPPLFASLLLNTSLLLETNYATALQALSLFFTCLLCLSIFLAVRLASKSETQAFVAALFSFAIPLLFYRSVTPISETFGLSIFVLCLYAYAKKDYKMAAILLVIAPLAHLRSFVFLSFALLAYALLERRKLSELVKISLPAAIPLLILYPFPGSSLSNQFVIESDALQVFSPFLLLLAIGGIAFYLYKYKKLDNLSLSVFAAFVATLLLVPFPFRQLAYLSLPMLAFSSYAATRHKYVLAACLVLCALTVSQNIAYRLPPFNSEELAAFNTLSAVPGQNAIASFKHNYGLASLSGKKVVAGPFLEEIPNAQERLNDLQLFFSDITMQEKIAEKYSANLIFVNDGQPAYSESKLFDGANYSAYAA